MLIRFKTKQEPYLSYQNQLEPAGGEYQLVRNQRTNIWSSRMFDQQILNSIILVSIYTPVC